MYDKLLKHRQSFRITLYNHKGCTYRAPIRYVTKTRSVVLLNKKTHILLSQAYCVWQVVKTPTVISYNPVQEANNEYRSKHWLPHCKSVTFVSLCSIFRALNRYMIHKQTTECTSMLMVYFMQKFSPTCFGRYCCHLQGDVITQIYKGTQMWLALSPLLRNNYKLL